MPNEVIERLLTHRLEKRAADYIYLDPAGAPVPAAPSDDVLTAFHKDNPALSTAPERRGGKPLVLMPQRLPIRVKISDKDLRDAFETRIEEFQPERRLIEQMLVNDEATRPLPTRSPCGADFRQCRGRGGAVCRQYRPGRDYQDRPAGCRPGRCRCSAAMGVTTAPVKTAFGWHLLRIVSITPGVEANFEDVAKPTLEATMQQDRALDLMFERSNKIEDLLSAGGSLDDAAAATGARLTDLLAGGPAGQTAAGNAGIAEDFPGRPQVLTVLFATEAMSVVCWK